MAHPVVWFEVNGTQSDELIGFYQKLFGWKIDASNPMHYGMVQDGRRGWHSRRHRRAA